MSYSVNIYIYELLFVLKIHRNIHKQHSTKTTIRGENSKEVGGGRTGERLSIENCN